MKQDGHRLRPPETPRTDLSEAESTESDAIARRGACRAVPVRDRDGRPSYIRLSDIPPPWQDAFHGTGPTGCRDVFRTGK